MRSPPRFIADAMLGSLARKLRIFGFDTLYFDRGGDREFEAMAKKERRVILTSDRRLFARSEGRGLRAIFVEGTTDRARLRCLTRRSGLAITLGLGRGRPSRCAVCNGELEVLRRRNVASTEIPAKVLVRHRLFFRCRSCSRFYWRGKHWERLRRLSYSLKTKDLI